MYLPQRDFARLVVLNSSMRDRGIGWHTEHPQAHRAVPRSLSRLICCSIRPQPPVPFLILVPAIHAQPDRPAHAVGSIDASDFLAALAADFAVAFFAHGSWLVDLPDFLSQSLEKFQRNVRREAAGAIRLVADRVAQFLQRLATDGDASSSDL